MTLVKKGYWWHDDEGRKWSSPAEYEFFQKRAAVPPTETKAERAGGTETLYDHPAFGQIRASRVTTTGAGLYGSDFPHRSFLSITVTRSQLQRGLSHDRYSAREQLIEVHLSEAQWATFISSLNLGEGVPCTLDWLPGEPLPGIAPLVDKVAQFKAEASEDLTEAEARIDEALALVRSGKLRKGELESLLIQAKNHMTGGVDFVAKTFGEHVETTVENARVEIEAYVTGAVQRAGLQALGAAPPVVTPPPVVSQPALQPMALQSAIESIGRRVRSLHDQRVGTVEGAHPLHGGWLVRFDGDGSQSLVKASDVVLLDEGA